MLLYVLDQNPNLLIDSWQLIVLLKDGFVNDDLVSITKYYLFIFSFPSYYEDVTTSNEWTKAWNSMLFRYIFS